LSEKEVKAQLEEFNKIRRSHSSSLDKKRKMKNDSMICEDIQHKDTQLRNFLERTRALIPRESKRVKLDEIKKLRDNEIHMKEQEKIELMRLEKVAKAQQIEEVS